jgi:hypothetical protein
MDQTPVPFSFQSNKTLEKAGIKTVHIRKSTSDTKRVTCALTVTASGRILTPFLIFKGSPKGRIVKKELPNFNKECIYACQENAWMDEEIMLLWVEKVLKPYVAMCPDGIVPLIFMDSFRCHMMANIVKACQDLGVQVEHIPGGCTYLCQPVDIGVNKPFKTQMRNLWENWMIDYGLTTGITKAPERADIAEWVAQAKDLLTEQIVRNSWRHGAYTFFPPTCEENPAVAALLVAVVAVATAAAVAVAMTNN